MSKDPNYSISLSKVENHYVVLRTVRVAGEIAHCIEHFKYFDTDGVERHTASIRSLFSQCIGGGLRRDITNELINNASFALSVQPMEKPRLVYLEEPWAATRGNNPPRDTKAPTKMGIRYTLAVDKTIECYAAQNVLTVEGRHIYLWFIVLPENMSIKDLTPHNGLLHYPVGGWNYEHTDSDDVSRQIREAAYRWFHEEMPSKESKEN